MSLKALICECYTSIAKTVALVAFWFFNSSAYSLSFDA